MNNSRETFGSNFAVIMAMAGSAIGLGNIWRFPYIVGQYGGAAFIIVYVIASLLLALPIFYAETIIGRASGANTFKAMRTLAPGTGWHWVGILTIVSPILIMGFYGVVGGWSIQYLVKSLSFSFINSDSETITNYFGTYISSDWAPLWGHFLFVASMVIITLAGVKKGIERFTKPSLPILMVLIIAIAVYSICLPGARGGVEYMLKPDFTKLTARGVAAALGQSFFSLSLGVGTILIYASYMKKGQNVFVSGIGTALFDVMFAIIAGFAIMPAVFAAGLEPGAGPGLIFETLPFIFNKMGASMPIISGVVSIIFFFSIFIAALTSAISLLEVGVAYLSEETRLSRRTSTIILGLFIWALGVICSLSFGSLSNITLGGDNFFGILDNLCSNILMPFGGLLFTIFVGWKMPKAKVYEEFTNGGTKKLNRIIYPAVRFLMRYVAPIGIVAIWLSIYL